MTVEGPVWSASGLRVGAGKYPLAVEQPVMARAARLVPGVTTVTPHARYFAVHGLVMAEVRARGLERAEAQDLLRRTEVALVAVSFAHHGGHDSPLGKAHGTDTLAQQLRTGTLTVQEVSAAGTGGYVGASWGFSGAYVGSEMTVGVLGAGREPGPACDEALLRRSLGGLLELAGQEQIRIADLIGHVNLCICAGAGSEDGDWLAALLCGTDNRASDTTATQRRRERSSSSPESSTPTKSARSPGTWVPSSRSATSCSTTRSPGATTSATNGAGSCCAITWFRRGDVCGHGWSTPSQS